MTTNVKSVATCHALVKAATWEEMTAKAAMRQPKAETQEQTSK